MNGKFDAGDEESAATLLRIERRLTALLSIEIDKHLRASPELAKPRPRSIDRLLSDAGLKGTEIAAILGKSPQAVSQALAADRKGSKAPAKTSAQESTS